METKVMTDTALRDLIVLGDLHLGEGKQDGRRYAPTEDFFFDADFARFLDRIAADYQENSLFPRLVLNGDVFDFLTVLSIPSDEEAKRRGIEVSRIEHRFGLAPTVAKSVYKLDVVARGHRLFFEALSRFISMGFYVEIIRGNHDLELHFPQVRERLVELLSQVDGGASSEQLAQRLRFHQLFYREPGRVHIEHGHQYDAWNSNRFPLDPVVTQGKRSSEDPQTTTLLDYPLGSVFVKYFYNHVRRFDPYSPRLVSPEQYMEFVQHYNVFDVWRIYREHYPYFLAAFDPRTHLGTTDPSVEESRTHQRSSLSIARQLGIEDVFERWNALKVTPESASKVAVVRQAMAPYVRRGLVVFGIAFVVLYLWIMFFVLIRQIPYVMASVFVTSLFGMSTAAAAYMLWKHVQKKFRSGPSKGERNTVETGRRLRQVFDVPVIVFGHNHKVENRVIDAQGTVLANAGTWTSVANPWSRIVNDARSLTFLRIIGCDVQLLRWNRNGLRFDEVPLFRDSDDVSVKDGAKVTIGTSADGNTWMPEPVYTGSEDSRE